MVTKNQIKFIKSLHQKKYRIANQLFFAEGVKVIQELLQSNFELEHLYETEADFAYLDAEKRTQLHPEELKKISALSSPNSCLALFKMPKQESETKSGLILALDNLRDPGNMGTIIRLCDWFGIKQIICTHETVDVYNPKVVQATMGSLARVKVNYVDLQEFISNTDLPVFGTFMDGNAIYKCDLPDEAIIVFGNEANGISGNISRIINHRISIPRFGDLQQTESLNVATAAAIILSEFRRNS